MGLFGFFKGLFGFGKKKDEENLPKQNDRGTINDVKNIFNHSYVVRIESPYNDSLIITVSEYDKGTDGKDAVVYGGVVNLPDNGLKINGYYIALNKKKFSNKDDFDKYMIRIHDKLHLDRHRVLNIDNTSTFDIIAKWIRPLHPYK